MLCLFVCLCMKDNEASCSLSASGRLVQCAIGNPLSTETTVTTQIRLDATNLPATRTPLNIAINVSTSVARQLFLWFLYKYDTIDDLH